MVRPKRNAQKPIDPDFVMDFGRDSTQAVNNG